MAQHRLTALDQAAAQLRETNLVWDDESSQLLLHADPTSAMQAATKQYVDSGGTPLVNLALPGWLTVGGTAAFGGVTTFNNTIEIAGGRNINFTGAGSHLNFTTNEVGNGLRLSSSGTGVLTGALISDGANGIWLGHSDFAGQLMRGPWTCDGAFNSDNYTNSTADTNSFSVDPFTGFRYTAAGSQSATNNAIRVAHGGAGTFRTLNNGDVANANNNYGGISDARLKSDITDATPKLADLLRLRVVNYNLLPPYEGIKQIGLIGDEVEQVFPSLVEEVNDADEGDEPNMVKTIKYSVLGAPILVKALQELTLRVEALEAQVLELQAGR